MAFGSGAFTQVSADRDVSIDINNDTGALIEITDQTDTDLVTVSDTLDINSDEIADGGEGFNAESEVLIGPETSNPDNIDDGSAAFSLDSNFDTGNSVELTVSITQEDGIDTFNLILDPDPGEQTDTETIDVTTDSELEETFSFETGDSVNAAIVLESTSETSTELNPTLTLTAEPTS